jgi:hypothetical protein
VATEFNSVSIASKKKGNVHGGDYPPGFTYKESVASGATQVKVKVERGSENNEPADRGETKPGLPTKPASPSPSPSPTPPDQRSRAGTRRKGTGGKAVRGGRKGVEEVEKKEIRQGAGGEQEGTGGFWKGPPALCACLSVVPDNRDGGAVIRTTVRPEGAVNSGRCRKLVIEYLNQFTDTRQLAPFIYQVDRLLKNYEHEVTVHRRSLLKLADEQDKYAEHKARDSRKIAAIIRSRNALVRHVQQLKAAGLRKAEIHIADLNRLAVEVTELRAKCTSYLEDKQNAEAKTEATEERLHLAIYWTTGDATAISDEQQEADSPRQPTDGARAQRARGAPSSARLRREGQAAFGEGAARQEDHVARSRAASQYA